MQPQLIVVRDQFAIRSLSNEALRQILPTYRAAIERILAELEGLPPAEQAAARALRLNQQLASIEQQLAPAAARIAQVLPPAQADAYLTSLAHADAYLTASGIETTAGPRPIPAGSPGAGVPSFDPVAAIGSPTITRQQLIAVAEQAGFVSFPGLIQRSSGETYSIWTATERWQGAQVQQIEATLREGFLTSRSTQEITRDVRQFAQGAGRAQTEALVRTSMAQASQAAHDAFNDANQDALGDQAGFTYQWDASLDSRLCSRCAPLDGKKYRTRGDAPSCPLHWNCRCRLLPITPLSDDLDALPGSFLERSPVQYDASGKRQPPPDGYDGDRAYKRPMKIDGEQYWVRRRDLPAGKTSAGDMLQRANNSTAYAVLGSRKRLSEFRSLTRPGGRLADDPQQALIDLLRPR